MAAEYQIIKPGYYDKFACAMAACEDNCCNIGWNIYIDKETYEKYRSVDNPAFIEKLDKHVCLVKEDFENDFYYAQFATAKEGYCPFQTKEGLCEIHRDFGEDYLSVTCKSYPRNSRRMTEQYLELSVSMSCPEAVRIALFDSAPMEFVIETVQLEEGASVPAGEIQPKRGIRETEYLKYGWELRDAAITIMQDRSCPIEYRIIIIAMMLSEIAGLHDEGNAGKIPETLDYYCSAAYGQEFTDGFRDTPGDEIVRLKMTTLLYYTIRGESAHPHSSKFTELINRFDRQGGSTADTDIAVNAAEFYVFTKEAMYAHWDSFIKDYEHVLENYLVNYMFTELFPMRYHGSGLDPYHHVFLLAEQYSILKMLLCGNFDPAEGFSGQYVVSSISQVAVINQHSEKPLKVAENYRNAGISTPAHLYYLLL